VEHTVITDSEAKETDPRLVEFYDRARAGDRDAQTLLARIYCGGVAIGRDDLAGQEFSDAERALYWFHEAAKQGHAEAETATGTMLTKGEGADVDHQDAIRWFQSAADQGEAEAMRRLGLAYAQGYGVEPNFAKAMKWWRLASEAGDCHAAFNLGMVHDGANPEMENRDEALAWFRRAMELGHPGAAEAIEKASD
jgi:TPR repeat protein